MKRGSVGGWLAGWLVLAGCGSSPGGEELAVDHAADFAGIWYGPAKTTYVQNTGTTSSTRDASQLIAVIGKNALQLPQFCSVSDQGVSARVTSATHFEMVPYQCNVSDPGYCPFTVKVAGGGGTLSGSTLAVDYHGTSGTTYVAVFREK